MGVVVVKLGEDAELPGEMTKAGDRLDLVLST
jgi:hypothetical protein